MELATFCFLNLIVHIPMQRTACKSLLEFDCMHHCIQLIYYYPIIIRGYRVMHFHAIHCLNVQYLVDFAFHIWSISKECFFLMSGKRQSANKFLIPYRCLSCCHKCTSTACPHRGWHHLRAECLGWIHTHDLLVNEIHG